MIGEIRQNFTEASASVGLILATALNRTREKERMNSFNNLYSAAVSAGNRIHEARSVEKPSLEFKGSLMLICYG